MPRGGGRYQVGRPYQVAGSWYQPAEDPTYDSTGLASWYGAAFHGRLTANGEVFDSTALSAAHPTLPLPSYVRVTNLANDRSIVVRVNDRGPYSQRRLIDVSERVADLLDFKRSGMAQVRVQYVDKAPLDGEEEDLLLASYRGPETGHGAGEEVMLASAAPGLPPATVAFAGDAVAPAGGAGAIEAVDAVSASYPADARIAMAFEIVSQFD